MSYLLKIDNWANWLVPAAILLIWLGKTFWNFRSGLSEAAQPEEAGDEEFEWEMEPDGTEENPAAAFEGFPAKAAEQGISVGYTLEWEPVPESVSIGNAPVSPEPVTVPVQEPPLPPPPGRADRQQRPHPLIAAVRADPRQSIVLAEVLGKPKALRR